MTGVERPLAAMGSQRSSATVAMAAVSCKVRARRHAEQREACERRQCAARQLGGAEPVPEGRFCGPWACAGAQAHRTQPEHCACTHACQLLPSAMPWRGCKARAQGSSYRRSRQDRECPALRNTESVPRIACCAVCCMAHLLLGNASGLRNGDSGVLKFFGAYLATSSARCLGVNCIGHHHCTK